MTLLWGGYGKTTGGLHNGKGRNATLYTGITSNLVGRTWQHREHAIEGFTRRYGVEKLVWYEIHGDMFLAINREKQIKKWNRAWKIRLIEESNPYWNDLWAEITDQSKVAGFPPSRE